MKNIVQHIAEHKYFERISVVLLLVSIGNIFLLENILINSFYISTGIIVFWILVIFSVLLFM